MNRRLTSPIIALALVAAACGGGSDDPAPTTAPPKQSVLETTTTAAPTTTAPTTTAPTTTVDPFCAEHADRTATALDAIDTTPADPTALADSLRAAGDYLSWLRGEVPADLTPNVDALLELGALADAFDGKPDFMAAIAEAMPVFIYYEDKTGFEDPGEAEYALDDYLDAACGTGENEVFKAVDEAMSVLDDEPGDEPGDDWEGDDWEGDDGWDEPDVSVYEGPLPDAPAGFCSSLEEQAWSILPSLMPMISGMDSEEPSLDQVTELFSVIDPIYGWLVENVPAELTDDAQAVRVSIQSMADTFANIDPETTSEDEIGMMVLMALMGAMGSEAADLETASLRLDTFLNRSCNVPMGEGPLAIIEVAGGGDEPPPTTEPPPPTTTVDPLADALRVPDDYATIQEAVDAAQPGDLVLIGPGTYHEAVIVETDDIVIRGTDRNEVVIDGQHERENGIIVFSNGVAVENLTSHSHTSNGVFFTGDYGTDVIVDGYRASYVTAYNNGLYGVYAFNATNGLIEHSYGSGHPDSAFYIGQCNPCNAVIRDVVAEHNALGYSGTNASGNLVIQDSTWRHNRIGMVPNTLDGEELAPQGDIVIVGNHVHDNGNEDTPRRNADWDAGFGAGILVAGGNDNLIIRNLVQDNSYAGIAVADFVDQNLWIAERNVVKDNVVSGSVYDLFVLNVSLTPLGNCFSGNTFETSIPADIETAMPCDDDAGALEESGGPNPGEFAVADHTTMPAPPAQPTMPGALTEKARRAGAPPAVNVAAVRVPIPGDIPDTIGRANWADPGIEVRFTPGLLSGYSWLGPVEGNSSGSHGGRIVGSGWPPGETVYLIPCWGSYETFDPDDPELCDWSSPVTVERQVPADGNIESNFLGEQDRSWLWGQPEPEGICAIIGTNGPDEEPSTGDEVGAVLCTEPAWGDVPEFITDGW